MKILDKYLSKEVLQHIPNLLGEKIDLIYNTGLYVDVSSSIIESHCFSLRCKKDYLNFQNFEKGSENYQFYEFNISFSDTPIGMSRDERGSMRGGFHIRIPVSNLVKIELFADKAEEEWNSAGRELITVNYDSALLFTQSNGNKFLLGVSESITEFVQFIWDKKGIDKRLKGLSKRLEWK